MRKLMPVCLVSGEDLKAIAFHLAHGGGNDIDHIGMKKQHTKLLTYFLVK